MVSCLRSLWGLGMEKNFGYLGCLFPSQDLKAFSQSLVPDDSLNALLAESPEAPFREGQWELLEAESPPACLSGGEGKGV